MVLFVFAAIILLASFAIPKRDYRLHRYVTPLRIAGAALLILALVLASVIQINVGEVGVKKLFGKVQKDVLGSGLHFINPLLEVQTLDIKTQNYTMSGIQDEGMKSGDDAIKV